MTNQHFEDFTQGTLVAHKSNMLRNNMGFGVVISSKSNHCEVLFPKIKKRYFLHHKQLVIMPQKSMCSDWTPKRRSQRGKR